MGKGRFTQIIGTGGIGKGIFFHSHENSSLGRNESRMAELSEARDYCKLHIVFHYLSALLREKVEVIPIGKVGNDDAGHSCRAQMKEIGMNMKWVAVSEKNPTMYSVCIQYPDKSGCNITSDNSACMEVDSAYILKAVKQLNIGENTMVVALPEVPLDTRLELLRYGSEKGAFCVASCGTAEIAEFVQKGGCEISSLLALNQEEAAELAGMEQIENAKEAEEAANKILERYSHLYLWLTFGAQGSLLATKDWKEIYAALPGVRVENTGGAGDASLAGLLTGFCLQDIFGKEREEALSFSGNLGATLGGLSVESPDSIHFGIGIEKILKVSDKE